MYLYFQLSPHSCVIKFPLKQMNENYIYVEEIAVFSKTVLFQYLRDFEIIRLSRNLFSAFHNFQSAKYIEIQSIKYTLGKTYHRVLKTLTTNISRLEILSWIHVVLSHRLCKLGQYITSITRVAGYDIKFSSISFITEFFFVFKLWILSRVESLRFQVIFVQFLRIFFIFALNFTRLSKCEMSHPSHVHYNYTHFFVKLLSKYKYLPHM